MPLSAAFDFFSPFLSEKKLLYQSFSPHLSSFSSLLLLISERLHSAPIFVILLFPLKNNKKIRQLTRQIAIVHKYFIQNKLEL